METVSNFVHDFANTGDCTSAYAVDFGVPNNGETAMVEWSGMMAIHSVLMTWMQRLTRIC